MTLYSRKKKMEEHELNIEQLFVLRGHSQPIQVLKPSHKSNILISVDKGLKLVIWDISTQKILRSIAVPHFSLLKMFKEYKDMSETASYMHKCLA